MGDVVNLEPGVRFVPTDEEVVMEYLLKAAMGEALPGNYVIERDLYADKAPWEILMTGTNNHEEGQGGGGDVVRHHLPWMNIRSRDENSGRIKTESTIYVLTALKKASRSGSGNRIGRRAGCGGWHGENGSKIVEVETGHVIGYKRMFTFEVQEESVSKDIEMGLMNQNHWIMHEYTLDYDDPTATTPCGGFAICKLMVDDSKKVKIAPKSRMRRMKTARVCSGGSDGRVHDDNIRKAGAMAAGSNIQAAIEKVVSEKIRNEDNDYHSRSRKRMRCVGSQADEEGNNYSDSQRRKKMPPLELAEDQHVRQQPTALTDDDGNALLTLLQEESTTNFGVDFDFEVDQYLNPVMWPATREPDDDQFTLPLGEDQERRLQEEEANQALSCTVVPNLDSGAPPDAALFQHPTSTKAAAVALQDQPECSMTLMVNNSGPELQNGSQDLVVEKEAAVPAPTTNFVDDVAGQYTWVPLPQQLPPALQEEEFSDTYIGDLWSF